MTFRPGSGTPKLFLPAAACAALTLVTSCSEPARPATPPQPPAASAPSPASAPPPGSASPPAAVSPKASVSPRSSALAAPEGRLTIEHRGVQVDVPTGWERADMSGCEFQFAQWMPAGSDPCRLTTGLAFYGAATFDPFQGPEVQKTRAAGWSGYVYSGSFAVYVTGTDRETVQEVLDSVRPRASDRP
jgi:hypothetical protein